jgi:hypothetical protein
VFKEYFRGLYFSRKIDSSPGALAQLDFKKGKITIKLKEDTSDTDATRIEKLYSAQFDWKQLVYQYKVT